jgi:diguanylate cyclase (GGDEF)-like protein
MSTPVDPNTAIIAAGALGYDWDLETDAITWCGAFDKFSTSSAPLPTTGAAFTARIHEDDRSMAEAFGRGAIPHRFRWQGPNGHWLWMREQGKTELNERKAIRRQGLLRSDDLPLTGRDYHHDRLTGFPNREWMNEAIERALIGARGNPLYGAYLVVAIDRMSFLNEALGKDSGDVLLRNVAERLARLMPERGSVARVGGDTFGILLPGPVHRRETADLAQRILGDFHDTPIATPKRALHITVSIGAVLIVAMAHDASQLMILAEQALKDARQSGRNLFIQYQPSLYRTQDSLQTLEIGERVKDALRNNRLRLAYQPVIDARTGDVNFFEALVRMFDTNGGTISAAEFIPSVESLGLVGELDRHVLRLAMEEMQASPGLKLSVNVSSLTASQSDWTSHVNVVLGPRPDIAKRMIFEITETAAIMDVEQTAQFLKLLQQIGSQAAMDDFGAGHTSIRFLRSLSFDLMKIDRDLLSNLMTNPKQQQLVRILIGIAHTLGLKAIVEGVETEDVVNWLLAENVDMLQGFYLGEPRLGRNNDDLDLTPRP